jgi:hypothetical protein
MIHTKWKQKEEEGEGRKGLTYKVNVKLLSRQHSAGADSLYVDPVVSKHESPALRLTECLYAYFCYLPIYMELSRGGIHTFITFLTNNDM